MKERKYTYKPRPWTEEDEELLVQMHNNGFTYKEMMESLQRGRKAINRRLDLIADRQSEEEAEVIVEHYIPDRTATK